MALWKLGDHSTPPFFLVGMVLAPYSVELLCYISLLKWWRDRAHVLTYCNGSYELWGTSLGPTVSANLFSRPPNRDTSQLIWRNPKLMDISYRCTCPRQWSCQRRKLKTLMPCRHSWMPISGANQGNTLMGSTSAGLWRRQISKRT